MWISSILQRPLVPVTSAFRWSKNKISLLWERVRDKWIAPIWLPTKNWAKGQIIPVISHSWRALVITTFCTSLLTGMAWIWISPATFPFGMAGIASGLSFVWKSGSAQVAKPELWDLLNNFHQLIQAVDLGNPDFGVLRLRTREVIDSTRWPMLWDDERVKTWKSNFSARLNPLLNLQVTDPAKERVKRECINIIRETLTAIDPDRPLPAI